MFDIEETLTSELHQVADGLHVPAMPPLEQQPSRAQRHWLPLLAAAAVLLVVLGVVAVVANTRGGDAPQPAPPSPSPTKVTEAPPVIPRTAPTIPYVTKQTLFVDGQQVPGTWWYLESGGGVWLAMRVDDGTWWWGRGPEPHQVEGASVDRIPVMSPNGDFVAVVGAAAILTGIDTRDGGTVGSVPIDVAEPGLRIRAVTDDGNVVVQGDKTAVLWRWPLGEGVTIAMPAPGEQIVANTPAGLLVESEDESEHYLAEISDTGELTKTGDLPALGSLVVSPDAEMMAWTPLGTQGGEVTAVTTLEVSAVNGSQPATLTAPDGWAFRVHDWAWEDDDYLVAPLVSDREEGPEAVARCSPVRANCVLIK